MAPKRSNAREPTPSAAATTQSSTTGAGSVPPTPIPAAGAAAAAAAVVAKPTTTSSSSTTSAKSGANLSAQEIALGIWDKYVEATPQRTKLIDVFMAFLVVVGVLQFVYCVLVGNFPFNAFLSGFSATVGQFVLTASLRIQTNTENSADFESVSPERAFADFIFGSMILHFFCVNFIN